LAAYLVPLLSKSSVLHHLIYYIQNSIKNQEVLPLLRFGYPKSKEKALRLFLEFCDISYQSLSEEQEIPLKNMGFCVIVDKENKEPE